MLGWKMAGEVDSSILLINDNCLLLLQLIKQYGKNLRRFSPYCWVHAAMNEKCMKTILHFHLGGLQQDIILR